VLRRTFTLGILVGYMTTSPYAWGGAGTPELFDQNQPLQNIDQHSQAKKQQPQDWPFYIQANTITYNAQTDIVTAEGDVEISQFIDRNQHSMFFDVAADSAEKDGKTFQETLDDEIAAEQSLREDSLTYIPTFHNPADPSKKKTPKKTSYKERYLKADSVIYNRKTQKITAIGNVVLIDEDKNAVFADRVELDDAFDNGFLEPLKILLANDEGRLTAMNGIRKGSEKNVFRKATYSPCHVCSTSPTPLWQFRSEKVTHNQVDKEIIYNHAFLDFLGAPVFYFPYFKHPDPSVKRKSGILMPTYGNSSDLGAVLQVPYFWVLGPHNDMTISPVITTKQGPVLAAEYRHRFERGNIQLNGSITRSRHLDRNKLRITSPGLKTPPKTRFHLFTKGRLELNRDHLFTFDLNRASDTTYLRRYSMLNGNGSVIQNKNLTSEIRLEQFKSNSYAGIRSYSFQTDTPRTTPFVLPLGQYMYKTDPGRLNETYALDGHFLGLIRREQRPGVFSKNSSRASLGAGFNLPYVNSSGHLYELDLKMRGDLYQLGDYQRIGQTRPQSYATGRAFSTGSLTWRYPLATGRPGSQYITEPIAQMVVSPKEQNLGRIPNEDSRFSELDDLNLFYVNRMNGYDRTDTGRRFVYGINNGFIGNKGRRLFVFLGQSYRLDRYNVSLIGDHKKASDYVTRIQVVPIEWFKIHYRGRFEREHMQNRFSEVTTNFGVPRLNLSQTIAFLDRRDTPNGADIKQMNWQLASQINENWSASLLQSKNYAKGQKNALANMASLVYQNECFQVSLGVFRSRFRDRDIKPDTGFLLQFKFKNLGGFQPYNTGTNMPNITLRKLDYGA